MLRPRIAAFTGFAALLAAVAFASVAQGAGTGAGIHIAFAHGSVVHSAPSDVRVRIYGAIEQGGRGVPGATVTIGVLSVAGPAPVGTARSDRHGRFAFTLAAGGTRTVVAVAGTTVSNTLLIEQGTHISLRASPHHVRAGGRVRFTGQIVGLVGSQVLVQLQVRKRAASYQTFLVVHTQADGSFHGAFRFSIGSVSYRFRALVVRQAGFPFARSTSNLVAVSVR